MKICHLAQEFARALVARRRRGDCDLHDLVAALIGALVEHAFLAQTEALGVGGALGNFQQGSPVHRRNFNLGTE